MLHSQQIQNANTRATLFSLMSFILVIAMIVWLLAYVWRLYRTQDTLAEEENAASPFIPRQYESVAMSLKRDCDVETIYAFDDEQCKKMCRDNNVSSQVEYRVNNGQCVSVIGGKPNKPGNSNGQIDDALENTIQRKCDPKQGLLGYVIGDGDFGGDPQVMCLSVDLGIRPDDPTLENQLCLNVEKYEPSINYTKRSPLLSDCVCPANHFLIIIPNNETIRMRGVCVPETQRDYYKSLGLVYDPSIV